MAEFEPIERENKGFINFLLINKFWIIILVVFFFLAIFFWKNSSTPSVFRYVMDKSNLLHEQDKRINILLLGMAGGKHEGATLTDTIMIASFDNKNNQVSLISLPRDLWFNDEKSKINAIYQKGLVKDNGLKYAEDKFSKILGIEIPYGIRVDFSGFIKAIDLIGGIDIDVQKSFDDYQYPIEGKQTDYCEYKEILTDVDEEKSKELNVKPGQLKILFDAEGKIATAAAEPGKDIIYSDEQVLRFFHCRFEHISFTKGLTHIDGDTALKFVRSRHGTNGEGSDFARSRRQQLVLQVFKEKVLSLDTLTDASKMIGLINTFGASIETDIPESKYLEFAGMLKKVQSVRSTVISTEGANPLLIVPPGGMYGAWVLIPLENDFSMIHNYLTDFLNQTDTATKSAKVKDQSK